jgi:hypothetical protein
MKLPMILNPTADRGLEVSAMASLSSLRAPILPAFEADHDCSCLVLLTRPVVGFLLRAAGPCTEY